MIRGSLVGEIESNLEVVRSGGFDEAIVSMGRR
jgi:hypothetical protein